MIVACRIGVSAVLIGHQLDTRTWQERNQELRRELFGLLKLPKDDPEREDRIKDCMRRMQELRDQPDVPGQPEWVRLHQQREKQRKEMRSKAPPILGAVRDAIERGTGRHWGDHLHVRCNLELTFLAFDVWYDLDEELEHDRASGRHEELASLMKQAARQIAGADSEVRFHSHQTVREKCGGDYFRYFR